ncbi:MAG: Hsp20/alpha crystallin family protein [Lachnospiraceae bacterium]|nr:Hsp20/alpha crystallin family protein [Lachnospiraceae bacterium]
MLLPSVFGESLFDDFMDDFFNDGFATPARRQAKAPVGRPMMRTDVRENEHGYQLDIDLPGYGKDDVKVQLKEGYLTVNATKASSNDEKDEKGRYVRRERYTGSMSRSFYVGDDVTDADIKAKFKDGILTLDIPKVEPKKQEEKYISIEG